jgi:deoxyribodipyrimidine photo-lyase
MRPSVILFWFRRDLRLKDNTALYHALKLAQKLELKVLPIFIFDKMILDKLEDKADKRVDFIHQTIAELLIKTTNHMVFKEIYRSLLN